MVVCIVVGYDCLLLFMVVYGCVWLFIVVYGCLVYVLLFIYVHPFQHLPAEFLPQDGRIAAMEEQLKPLPYFFRGVSHWLFPSRSNTKGGFHSLKRNAGGHWVPCPP
jgi:hypothetical protein